MPKFLNDISLEQANDLQFKTAAGANAGKIEQDGNNLVLTNPVGDIMLGDGAADIYIGDGTNSVDILFEQSGSIKAEDGTSGVTLTLGSSDTTLAFGGATSFADVVTAFSGVTANTVDVGTSAKPFKNIYAAHHVGGTSINYATSRGWVEDPAPMEQTQSGEFGGGFTRNGSSDENELVRGLDPFGNKALLWKMILNQPGSNDDGGWNKEIVIPANNNIGYLSYVYFKVDFTADNTNDGTVYLGCGTTSGQTINVSNDSSNTNPYFVSNNISTLNNGNALIANRWYLLVGVIQPYNDETTGTDTICGTYDVETGEKIMNGAEYKMGNNTTGQKHRAYVYYDESTDNNENGYFWNPGFHAIDGSEPKIQDLVKRQTIATTVKVGRDAHNLIDFTTDNQITVKTNDTTALTINSGQTATFAGEINIPSKITHVGDTTTWVGFDDSVDSFRVVTNATERFHVNNTRTRISNNNLEVNGALDLNGNADISGDLTMSGHKMVKFSSTTYGDFDSEDFFRIKFRDNGGTHNDVGIGMTDSDTLGFNTGAGGSFEFNDGTNGNVLTISNGQATFDGEIEGGSLDINGNADISGTLDVAGDTTITNGLYVNHNDGIQIAESGNASTSRTFLTSFNSAGNSQMKIKGGNFVHRVNFETSKNDFNYAYLTSSYNGSDTSLVLNKSNSDTTGTAATTTISTGTSTFAGAVSATEFRPTNIVTNKVVKFNGTQLDDANITDTGSLITLGSNTVVSGELEATSLDIDGNADISGNLTGVDDITASGTVTASKLNLDSMGDFITFYGDDEANHSISSRNASGSADDDLRINSYGAVYINLDSNSNNSSGADFVIGRHGSATGTMTTDLLTLSGENGKLDVNGEVECTSLDVNGDADISGTLTSVTYQGDVIASAYLDSDTAHLSSQQTFSGIKTFTSSGNHYNGHLYFDAYDTSGNHYPHFLDGSGNSGSQVNWRQYYGSSYKTHTWTSDASGNMGFTYQGAIIAVGSLTATGLDINGNADISGSLSGVDTLTALNLVGTPANASTHSLKLGRTDNSNYWYVNHAGNDFRLFNEASSGSHILFGVDASGNVKANNVGIGTPDPDQKLHVVGNFNLDGDADISGNLAVDGTANLDNTDIDGTFKMDGSSFDVNGTTTVTIDNSNTTNGVKINTVTSGSPVTIGHTTSEVIIGDNLVVNGNLTTKGDTILESTTNTTIKDTVIQLNDGVAAESANTSDTGILINRGSLDKVFMGWDETADKFVLATTSSAADAAAGTLTGLTTETNYQTLVANIIAPTIKIGFGNSVGEVHPTNTSTSLGTSNTVVPSQNAVKAYVDGLASNYATSAQGTLAANALPKAGGTMSGDIAMGNNDITGVKFIQYNGDVDIRTSTGEYAIYAAANGQTALYHNGVKTFENTSIGVDITGGTLGFSTAGDITFPDNSGAALEFKEGSNLYMRFITTNSAEKIEIEKATTISNSLQVNALTATSLDLNGTSDFNSGTTNLVASFTSTDSIGEIRIADSSKYTRLLTVGSSFKIMPNDGSDVFELTNSALTVGVNLTAGSNSLTAGSLDINGNADISGTLNVGQVDADGNISVVKGSATIKVEESGGADVRMVAGGSTGYIGTYSNDTLQIQQNSAAAITIDTSRNSTFAGDVIVTDGSDTSTLSETGLVLSRSNSYIQSNADNSDTLNIGQSSVRWGHVKVDGADFAVLNGGTERFKVNSSGNSSFYGDLSNVGASHTLSLSSGSNIRGNNHLFLQGDASYVQIKSVGNNIYLDGAAHYFRSSNASANYVIFSSTSATFSTNVDINGSADISGALDVNGNLAVEDEIHLTDGGSTVRGKLLLNSSDRDNVELRAESLGSTMKFFTVGTEALLLDASQNATFAGSVTANGTTLTGNTGDMLLGTAQDITAHKEFQDNIQLRFGNDNDMMVQHTGSHGYWDCETGNMYIRAESDNSHIYLQADDGNGSNTTYIDINGNNERITMMKPVKMDQRRFAQTTSTDGDHQGDVVFFGGATSMKIGRIYYYTSGGSWALADPNAASTSDGLLAVALGATSDTDGMLLRGMVTLDHDPGTIGDPLYLNEADVSFVGGGSGKGAAHSSIPAGTGDIVRVIGYCVHNTQGRIWFNPDNTFVEVA